MSKSFGTSFSEGRAKESGRAVAVSQLPRASEADRKHAARATAHRPLRRTELKLKHGHGKWLKGKSEFPTLQVYGLRGRRYAVWVVRGIHRLRIECVLPILQHRYRPTCNRQGKSVKMELRLFLLRCRIHREDAQSFSVGTQGCAQIRVF